MRGLLVVNLHATTTSPHVTEVLVQALAGEMHLEVCHTEHRGHAFELGDRARREGMDIVCTLGGDGTVNETVNGMLSQGPGPDVPRLVPVPGGSANVFARALGLPAEPVEAAGWLLEAVRQDRTRTIGLATATITHEDGQTKAPHWFLANAGLGIDAEIIEAMEAQRSQGHEATPLRYLTTTLRQYFIRTNRREPSLSLLYDGERIEGVFLAIVQNTSPWTYLGAIPVDPCPRASFDDGLDVFAVRTMSILGSLRVARRMLARSVAGSTKKSITVLHDLADLTLEAARPTPLQVDGEGMGRVIRLELVSVPQAITTYI